MWPDLFPCCVCTLYSVLYCCRRYLTSYDVGSQHACFYPSGELEKITFDSPVRVDGLLFSFTLLLPFVLMAMIALVLLLHTPKPHFDTMVQRTEKMIATHDKKTKKQNEDNLKEIAVLRGKIEREQEKRLQFVTELTQERGERIRQYVQCTFTTPFLSPHFR